MTDHLINRQTYSDHWYATDPCYSLNAKFNWYEQYSIVSEIGGNDEINLGSDALLLSL
jgi:hypothetical protein